MDITTPMASPGDGRAMRYVRFRDRGGYVRSGEWTDDGILAADELHDVDAVDVLPPCEPTKLVCVGENYATHVEETGEDSVNEIPDRPLLFLKPPNAVAGHGDTITLPTPGVSGEELAEYSSGAIERGQGRIDHEGEVGVVIGRQCRHVSADAVDDVIAGYTCVNDVSNRDDQGIERNWVRGKAFDGAAPMGPVVATPEHVPDNPRIRLWVNGEKRQDSAGDHQVYTVPEVIADVTKFLTLEPGDVICMGTTAGVAPLRDGDTVRVEVEGVGTLEHGVRSPRPRGPDGTADHPR